MGQPHTRGRCFGPQAQQLGLGAGWNPQIIPPGAGGCSPSGGKGAARSPRGLLAPAASRSQQGKWPPRSLEVPASTKPIIIIIYLFVFKKMYLEKPICIEFQADAYEWAGYANGIVFQFNTGVELEKNIHSCRQNYLFLIKCKFVTGKYLHLALFQDGCFSPSPAPHTGAAV